MVKTVLPLVMAVLMWTHICYTWSGVFIVTAKYMGKRLPRHSWFNGIWRWTKWPALAYTLGDIPGQIIMGEPITWVDYLALLINMYVWYIYRDVGDDDPMDKLKDKIKEKVEEVNGRLVLVPVGS